MLYPLNKYLVVEPVEEEQKEESAVLVPDDVQVQTSPYSLMKLVEPNVDSKLRPGMRLLTHSHLIETAEISGEKYYFTTEASVIAFYEEA